MRLHRARARGLPRGGRYPSGRRRQFDFNVKRQPGARFLTSTGTRIPVLPSSRKYFAAPAQMSYEAEGHVLYTERVAITVKIFLSGNCPHSHGR